MMATDDVDKYPDLVLVVAPSAAVVVDGFVVLVVAADAA